MVLVEVVVNVVVVVVVVVLVVPVDGFKAYCNPAQSSAPFAKSASV